MLNGSSFAVAVSEFGEAATCVEGDAAASLKPSFSGTLITMSPPLLILLSAITQSPPTNKFADANGSQKEAKNLDQFLNTIVEKHIND